MESLGDLTFLDKPFFAFQKFDILVQSRPVLFYDLEVRYPGFSPLLQSYDERAVFLW